MWQQPYKPINKQRNFDPSPVAGKIPSFADGMINPRVIGTQRYKDFWDEQIDRCRYGYETGGIKIPGRYYYFLNFVIVKGLKGPQYPWYVDLDLEYYQLVDYVKEKHKSGVVSIKARRKGLSEKAQTVLNHGLRFTPEYRGAITAGIETYTEGLRSKFDSSAAKVRDEFRLNVLKDNDKKYQIGYHRKNPIGGYIEDGYGGMLSFETMYDDPKKLEGEYFHDVVCEESGQYKMLSSVFESIKPALEFGSEMLGTFYIYGCVCAGTKVWDNTGNLVNIENLKQEDGILGFDGAQVSKESITYMQPPAEKECVRIITNTGRTLECSEDHPILWSHKGYLRGPHKTKLKATKFVEAKDIKPFDQVATIESVPIYGTKKMWEPRLVGWLIGDGSYGFDKTPVLSGCDNEINDYVLKNFDSVIEKSHLTKDLKLYQETRIKGICQKLRELSIYGQTKLKKRLPLDIQSYRKEDICELLGGFFDTDGSVNANKGGFKIVLTASSYDLLFETQLLLQKIGIHCNVDKIKATPNSGKGGTNDYYKLNILDGRSIIAFHEQIYFKLRYKQEKLERITEWFKNKGLVVRNGVEQIMRKGVPGLRFERVVSVESIGMQRIYNLTAGNTHTYIANGIVTHNTGGNILSTSKDFKEFWDQAETYGLEKFWVPGTRFYFPFFGNHVSEHKTDDDTGEKIDAVPNLRHMKDYERVGCEDLKAGEEYILRKRVEYAKLPNKKKLKELNQNYPLTVEEAFTSGGSNNFNDEKIYDRLFTIEGDINNYKPMILEWVHKKPNDNDPVATDELSVSARPAKPNDPDGKIIWVYQQPRKDMMDLDIGGVDGYNQDQTQTSSSLGAMTVVRQGNRVNMEREGIHKAEYPVCLYYKRPGRKEDFYETCLKISVWYNLIRNTMCSAEQDFVIDYYAKHGGRKYLSPRPKTFDSKKSQQMHKYGAKMTGFSKDIILGIVQSWVEDFVQYCNFPDMLRDLLAYDEEYVGTDWDSVDALAYAKMRIEDMKTRPRKSNSDEQDTAFKDPEFVFDEDGNAILKRQESNESSETDRNDLTEGNKGYYQYS